MNTEERTDALKRIARVAGILYLVLVVVGPFSLMYIPSSLYVPGDGAATAGNIVANEMLFRIGIVTQSVIFLVEIVLPIVLYVLLKPVNKTLSLVAMVARLAMAVVQGINLLNHFAVLELLSGADYLTAFEPDQLYALVSLFLSAHGFVSLVWGLFFGLHLLFLGYLVYRSSYIPRLLGVFLLVASLCYLVSSFGSFLFPEYSDILASVGLFSIVEIAFPLWLLIKGVREQQEEGAA